MNATEQLVYGLIVTLIGMGIVFIVLIGLSYMLDLLKVMSNRDKASQVKEDIKPIEKDNETTEEDMVLENEDELIAVISAAIASVMGTQSSIVVRSIRRVNDQRPLWAKIAKQEQIYSRF